MGDSRGRWDGNTLVADVTSFSDTTWLDAAGTLSKFEKSNRVSDELKSPGTNSSEGGHYVFSAV